MSRTALIRYNFRVLMFHNWWLLVIPLAASQLTVFWTASTQRFTPPLPSNIVELISPALAAFLCAHLLSAEYRSGIGAVIASKPIHIGKVVLWRLLIVMGLVWALGGLSLLAFYQGMEPYPMGPPAIAMMVSSLFLGLLALTFATLFRHPLTGFGFAILYWALDLPSGPPINPYLSLKSLTSSIPLPGVPPGQYLTENWLIAKAALLVLSVALYFWHSRLLFTLGSPLTMRRRKRAFAFVGTMLLGYLISGAVIKVTYGYSHRGSLVPDDTTWFRKQFAPYGPLPVAALFGPNFQRYLGKIPNAWRIQQEGEPDTLGNNDAHRRDLKIVLEKAPDSIWAPSAAELLARFQNNAMISLDERVANYRLIGERYSSSPLAPIALQQAAHIYADAAAAPNGSPALADKARSAYEDLLKRFPQSEFRSEAYRFLALSEGKKGAVDAAVKFGQEWANSAPVYDAFNAWMFLAETWRSTGKPEEAKRAISQTREAIRLFRKAVFENQLTLSEPRRVRIEKEASALEDRMKQF